jgi:hypothetical protein
MKKAKCYNCKKVLTYTQDLGGPEADVEVWANRDTDHRYVTVNILDKVLH